MIRLLAMTDADFAWLLDGSERAGLSVAEGGIAPPAVIEMLRGVTRKVAEGAHHPVAWLVAHDHEVVGMISFTKPGREGQFELGYGIVPSREGRGFTSAAVAALLAEAHHLPIRRLTAETSVANPASQRVLEKNGFHQTGTRSDPEDGELLCWSYDVGSEQ